MQCAESASSLLQQRNALWSDQEAAADRGSLASVSALALRVGAADAAAALKAHHASAVAALNVGGVHYDVPEDTLRNCPYFATLLDAARHRTLPVATDRDGRMLVDRDGSAFRFVLAHLRGEFPVIAATPEDLVLVADDFNFYGLTMPQDLSRHLARTALTMSTSRVKSTGMWFEDGPGIKPNGREFRSTYLIGTVGAEPIVAGRHFITFRLHSAPYLALGVITESAIEQFVTEPHKTPGCVFFYMNGTVFENCPHHTKVAEQFRLEAGMTVSLLLDMNERTIELLINGASARVSCLRDPCCARLRFAVVAKQGTVISIHKDDGDGASAS